MVTESRGIRATRGQVPVKTALQPGEMRRLMQEVRAAGRTLRRGGWHGRYSLMLSMAVKRKSEPLFSKMNRMGYLSLSQKAS